MNRFSLYFAFFLAVAAFANADTNDSALESSATLSKLKQKEATDINTYSGFYISLDLVQNKPNTQILFEKVQQNPTLKSDIKVILTERGGGSNAAEQNVLSEINALTTFTPSKVVMKNDYADDRFGQVVRFDYLDNSNVKRISEWRFLNSGFQVKTATYDEKGQLLSMNFYVDLKINGFGSDEDTPNFGKVFHIHLDKTKSFKNTLLYNEEDTQKFENALLEKSKQLIGYGVENH